MNTNCAYLYHLMGLILSSSHNNYVMDIVLFFIKESGLQRACDQVNRWEGQLETYLFNMTPEQVACNLHCYLKRRQ